MPSFESAFRNLRLNQRIAPFARDQLLTPDVWALGDAAIDEAIFVDGRPVYGGIDLSARTDLSALVLAAEDDAASCTYCRAPGHLPIGWLRESRATAHRMTPGFGTGISTPVPGTAIDYDWIAYALGEDAARMNIVRLNYDRWRIEILRQVIGAARRGDAA